MLTREMRWLAPDRETLSNRTWWLTLLSMGVAIGMLALGAVVLVDARGDAWREAQRASANLALALEQDIVDNITAYDLSLQGAKEALEVPGIDQVSPQIRQIALFDRAATAKYLGSLVITDAEGNIVADSTAISPHRMNLADRDYFRAQKASDGTGLYVSLPYRSRLRGGDPSIAISRRLFSADGSFKGIVAGALRLQYFRDLFAGMDVGPHGSIVLIRTDGKLIERFPFRAFDSDRDVSQSEVFQRLANAQSGQFVGVSSSDEVRRLFTFRRVGQLPLILGVGLSVNDIFAAWRTKALTIGYALAVLCMATVALCLLLRQELAQRLAAQTAAVQAAEKLSVLAATDGLTGLLNRRQFDVHLDREWRRATRDGLPLGLLLMDVDCFKSYNDAYGHPCGDKVLKLVAGCIQESLRRPLDLCARYGGEEFVVILPETELAEATMIAERIRDGVALANLPHSGSQFGCVTVSVGVAMAYPRPGEGEYSLVNDADRALYEAKLQGRNRVCLAAVYPGSAGGAARATTPARRQAWSS